MKRLTAVLLALLLFLSPACQAASAEAVTEAAEETPQLTETVSEEQQKIYDEYVEELKESKRVMTVPVGSGLVHSILVKEDGFGIVLNLVTGKTLADSLKALAFLADLTAVDVYLENGEKYAIPAVVEIQFYNIGAFVTLNITVEAAKTLAGIIGSKSLVEKIVFTQGSGKQTELTVAELNESLSKVTGKVVDVLERARRVVRVFWLLLSRRVVRFASNAYDAVQSLIADVGSSLQKAGSEAGEKLQDAAKSVVIFLSNAVEGIGAVWNRFWKR